MFMEPTAASFVPLDSTGINLWPYVIIAIVLAGILYLPSLVIAGKVNKSRDKERQRAKSYSSLVPRDMNKSEKRAFAICLAMIFSTFLAGVAFIFVNSENIALAETEDKIISNIQTKYEVSRVSIDDPDGTFDNYWVDDSTGKAVTIAEVTRVVDGQIIKVKYDAVIDQQTGEPVLAAPASENPPTDPKTFLR